jgi:hypothetical protein
VSDYSQVTYQSVVSGWHDFYVVAGTASATLAGLLFVALSLHLRIVVANSDVRGLARVTLANFGTVLFMALFMVIPEPQAAAASQLIGVGLVSIVVTVPSLVAASKGSGRTLRFMRLQRLVLRFGLSCISYLTILVAGILLLSSVDSAFVWLVIATVVLLLISLRNTWDLLVTVGDATLGAQTGND